MARARRIFWSRIKIIDGCCGNISIFKNTYKYNNLKKGHAHEIYSAATWMKATNTEPIVLSIHSHMLEKRNNSPTHQTEELNGSTPHICGMAKQPRETEPKLFVKLGDFLDMIHWMKC